MAKYGAKAQRSVKGAMNRLKKGVLKTSHGRTVRKRSQALAIGLSEARRKGAKVPKKAKKTKSRTKPSRRAAKAATTRRKTSRAKSKKRK